MVPTLPFSISDFTLADTGNLGVPTPECPMAFSPGGRFAAVNGYGFTLGSFAQRPVQSCERRSSPRSTVGSPPRRSRMNRYVEP
jgi:hypothetical protein